MRWNPKVTHRQAGAIFAVGIAAIGAIFGPGIARDLGTTADACVQERAAGVFDSMNLDGVTVRVASGHDGEDRGWVNDLSPSTIFLATRIAAQCNGTVAEVDELLDTLAHEAGHVAQHRLVAVHDASMRDLESALGGTRSDITAIEWSADCVAFAAGRVNTPATSYGVSCGAADLTNARDVIAGRWPTVLNPPKSAESVRGYGTPVVGAVLVGNPAAEIGWVRAHGLDVAVNAHGAYMVVDPGAVPAGWSLAAGA